MVFIKRRELLVHGTLELIPAKHSKVFLRFSSVLLGKSKKEVFGSGGCGMNS